MKLFLLVFAVTLTGAGAAAADPKCDAQQVVADLAMPTIARAVELAQTVATLSAHQMALQPKNTSANEPVGKFMTEEQIEQFGELNGEILVVTLSEFANSDYERDLLLIVDLLSVAQTRYEDKPIKPFYTKYADLLDALSATIHDNKPEYRNSDGCNFYTALAPTIANLNDQLGADSASLTRDQAALAAMAQKYGVARGNLSNTSLSPEDSLVVTPIYSRISQAVRTLQYARDLIHIEGLFQVSQIIHETRVQAISTYGAAPNKINDALDKRITATADVEQRYFRAWGAINERFPSDEAKFAARLAAQRSATSGPKK